MRPQHSRPIIWRFPLVEILVGAILLGLVAFTVVPQFTDNCGCTGSPYLQYLPSQLQTIRSQIALYNVQNPATTIDDATPVVGFWDRLVKDNYLQTAPKNALQNSSTVVGSSPGAGVGWVWMQWDPADSRTLNLYAVDENGALYDADGDGMPD